MKPKTLLTIAVISFFVQILNVIFLVKTYSTVSIIISMIVYASAFVVLSIDVDIVVFVASVFFAVVFIGFAFVGVLILAFVDGVGAIAGPVGVVVGLISFATAYFLYKEKKEVNNK